MSGISLETPLAEQLNAIVHQKITEEGWSTEEDTSLAEYIVLMLVNGKTQDQISSELASELLQDVDGIPQFAQWLSDQVAVLKNGGDAPMSSSNQPMVDASAEGQSEYNQTSSDEIPAAYDTDMGDNAPDNASVRSETELRFNANNSNSPKGPKNLHGGRGGGRGGRMGGQVNKTNDRSGDSVLHRVRGQAGSGRIDSHTRGTPKGPRGGANRPGLQKALNGMVSSGNAQGIPSAMMQTGGQANPMMPAMSPQQQMEFMAMMEQQARMMAQLTGMVPGGMNSGFQQNGQHQSSQQQNSLFDRVQAPGRGGRGGRGRGRGFHQNGTTRNGSAQDSTETESNAPSSAMETESTAPNSKNFDPSTTLCRYNKRCINQDCPYAHVSPAAPDNTTLDMTTTCSFGVACKNSKCAARHPSPAQLKAQHAEEVCKFFPNCANPVCSYKHPSAPPCRNGADCTREGCTFTHLQVACRFNPCTNRSCPYKHAEGQKVKPHSNVWVSEAAKKDAAMSGADDGNHVSNRKFVEDGAEEELIKPEQQQQALDEDDVENIGAAQAEGIIA